MLTNLKRWFHRPVLADYYPELTKEIMDLIGKEMAPLFEEIRLAFFEAVYSLPYQDGYDYPFGLYHYSLKNVKEALVENVNRRFTTHYEGKHKENTFQSWAGINRNLLMIAICELFAVSDHLLIFFIRGKQEKRAVYNFFFGESLKTFCDRQSGFVFERTREDVRGLNAVVFTQVVNGGPGQRLIERIGQDSFLLLLTRIDNRKRNDELEERPPESLSTSDGKPDEPTGIDGPALPSDDDIPESCFEGDNPPDVHDNLSLLRSYIRSFPVFKDRSDPLKLVVLENHITALTVSGLKALERETHMPRKEILDLLDQEGVLKKHDHGRSHLLAGLKGVGITVVLLKNEFWNGHIPEHVIPGQYNLIEKPAKEGWEANG